MLISESYVNATEGYRCGDVEPYEPFTDDVGRLFRAMQEEYGRCTGHVYIDHPPTGPQKIGWVFQKMVKYDDCAERYLQEVWITLHDEPDTVTRQHHYHVLNRGK